MYKPPDNIEHLLKTYIITKKVRANASLKYLQFNTGLLTNGCNKCSRSHHMQTVNTHEHLIINSIIKRI